MTRKNKKFIASIIMAMMMVLAMVPSMAFADTVTINNVEYTSSVTIPGSSLTVNPGIDNYLTCTSQTDYNSTSHIDWSVENGTGTATIGKHNGKLVGGAAGTVTVTASLIAGPATGGSGDGTGGSTNNTPCAGTVLASDTLPVTVSAATSYTYQGEGGNTLLLEQISGVDLADSAITYRGVVTDSDGNRTYNNLINTAVVANDDDMISFGYTMSAGINSFNPDTFDGYKSYIGIYDSEGIEKLAPVEFGGFSNRIVTINASVSDEDGDILREGETYILRFGPNVCGNNTAKKLGCNIDFEFVYGTATEE